MQQALTRMNMPVREILTGVIGQAILRALVQGERDPLILAP
jgi:hypothetical protein